MERVQRVLRSHIVPEQMYPYFSPVNIASRRGGVSLVLVVFVGAVILEGKGSNFKMVALEMGGGEILSNLYIQLTQLRIQTFIHRI